MNVHACMYVYERECGLCRPEVDLRYCPQFLYVFLFETGSLTECEAHCSKTSWPHGSPCICFHSATVTGMCHHAWFCVGAGDLNSGPHASLANTFTKPAPSPQRQFLICFLLCLKHLEQQSSIIIVELIPLPFLKFKSLFLQNSLQVFQENLHLLSQQRTTPGHFQ